NAPSRTGLVPRLDAPHSTHRLPSLLRVGLDPVGAAARRLARGALARQCRLERVHGVAFGLSTVPVLVEVPGARVGDDLAGGLALVLDEDHALYAGLAPPRRR